MDEIIELYGDFILGIMGLVTPITIFSCAVFKVLMA